MSEPRTTHLPTTTPPGRFERIPVLGWVMLVVLAAVVINGLQRADLNLQRLERSQRNLFSFLREAFPPSLDSLDTLGLAMLTTLQMAIVGVVLGVLLSLPLALLAARNTSPAPPLRWLTRIVIATMRTIPDLIWAMIFVIMVGFGPLAGILAIVMDTIGFCGRFFSERIEETSKGPVEALTSTGARRHEVVLGAILPEAMPSFVGTSLFAVEKAIRSAVVLGLVGAGGIGVELSAAIDLFNYDEACTIILMILVVVIAAEQLSSLIRKRML